MEGEISTISLKSPSQLDQVWLQTKYYHQYFYSISIVYSPPRAVFRVGCVDGETSALGVTCDHQYFYSISIVYSPPHDK